MWIQHLPEFRIIVQFTEDGNRTIAPYLEGRDSLLAIVDVRPVKYSYAHLEMAQQMAVAAINNLTLSVDVEAGINIPENQAEIYVKDRNLVAEALREADVRLPPSITILEVDEFVENLEAAASNLARGDEARGMCLTDTNAAAASEIYAGLPLSSCTSGWSVRESWWWFSRKGIVTAGHCGAGSTTRRR